MRMHKVRDEVDKPAVSNDDSRGDRSSMQKRVTVHSLLGGDGANPISRGRGSERRRCHSVQVILMRRGSAAREEVPGQHRYLDYMYMDMLAIYKRVGRVVGRNRFIMCSFPS